MRYVSSIAVRRGGRARAGAGRASRRGEEVIEAGALQRDWSAPSWARQGVGVESAGFKDALQADAASQGRLARAPQAVAVAAGSHHGWPRAQPSKRRQRSGSPHATSYGCPHACYARRGLRRPLPICPDDELPHSSSSHAAASPCVTPKISYFRLCMKNTK
jgi:hypothetical protein